MRAPQREGNQGLGVISAATPEECDNEYDAYRKRMMLAYRFRPNPLVSAIAVFFQMPIYLIALFFYYRIIQGVHTIE